MKNLGLLIPQAPKATDSWTWATVTQASPLRVRLDGEVDPLDIAPDCLFPSPVIGQRVWVQLTGRRVIVHSASGGTPGGVVPIGMGLKAASTNAAVGNTAWVRPGLGLDFSFGNISASSSSIVIDTAGYYQLEAGLIYEAGTGTTVTRRIMRVESYTGADPGIGNGARHVYVDAWVQNNGRWTATGSRLAYLAVGTTVRIATYQASGATLNISNSTDAFPAYLSAHRVA